MRVELIITEGRAVLKVVNHASAPVVSLSFERNGRTDYCGREVCSLDAGCPVMPSGTDESDVETLRVLRSVLMGMDLS